MRHSSLVLLLVALMLWLVSPAAAGEPSIPAAAALKSHIMIQPAQVTWEPCSNALPPGAQCATIEGDRTAQDLLFTMRVKVPDGYRVPPHFHPADEHLTVISGTFNIGMGTEFKAGKGTALGAGSFAVMPKGLAHYAWTTGETIIQVHAIGPWGLTYVNPADDPRTAAKPKR